jgi:large subunit ribosomal protein L16
MLYIPNNFKYKKQQKGKSFCRINKNVDFLQLKYGSIGLKALTCGRLTSKEIKTAHQLLNKKLKRRGFIKVNVYPQNSISKKPLEIRMGKGKGNVDHWVFNVRPGMILFEVETEFRALVMKALKLVQIRLSVDTKIIF